MNKARREINALIRKTDLVIELLDARIPFSSSNPMVASMRRDKPCIKLLNKADLADPETTDLWKKHLAGEQNTAVLVCSRKTKLSAKKLESMASRLLPHRNFSATPLRALILGIPNVGKSTLINAMAKRSLAKTGNEPAVTRIQQRVRLPDSNLVLHDTPGLLWPRIEPEVCGYRLAATGAIKQTLLEHEDIALFLLDFLLKKYPDKLQARYEPVRILTAPEEMLDALAVRRGCVRKGLCERRRISEILLNDYRSGSIGPISLETPEMIAEQIAATEAAQTTQSDESLV